MENHEEKFRQMIANRIYLGNPGFEGYSDAAKDCATYFTKELTALQEKYNKLKEAFKEVVEENWEFMESSDAAGIGSLNGLTKEKFVDYEYKKAGLKEQ